MGAKNDHHSYVRGLLLALALSAISLNVAAVARYSPSNTRANGQAVWDAAVNGKTTTVGGGNGSMRVTGPYQPGSVNANGDVVLKTGADIPVNGKNVPGGVTGTIAKGDIANAAIAAAGCAAGGGGVAGAVVCGGAAVAIPIALNWMANAGVSFNPDTKALQVNDPKSAPTPADGLQWQANAGNSTGAGQPWRNSPTQACKDGLTYLNSVWSPARKYSFDSYLGNGTCKYSYTDTSSPGWTGYESGSITSRAGGCALGQYVSVDGHCSTTNAGALRNGSIEDAVGLMNNSRIPDPAIVKELDFAGQTDKMPTIAPPTVTGPASITGPTVSTVTNNSTTNTTTNNSTTTNNYNYSGGTVTNTSTVTSTTTTTAVKNADGSTTTTTGPSTTTTTTNGNEAPAKPEAEKDTPTQCDKYPDTLGCAQLDTPEGEIPKENKTVTFQAEDVLGSGACPANVTASFATLGGQSATIVDWQTFCGMALPLRGLVIALASIMAFFIIMPGGVRE